jgi:type II secretory pathway predicted ATPase ExeA/tetratricopeptide (TPR) repeat protein
MYDSFYQVNENPFKICTDPRFLWCGEKHSRILSSLIYGLMDHNGLIVLTGDIGTGKTTLVNAFLKIVGSDVYVAEINHPRLSANEFLTLVAKRLDKGFTGTSKSDLLLFFDSFFRRVHAEGKIVLLIIDEAQQLPIELLEEIRLLSNMEYGGQRILSIMLVGQSELKVMIKSPQSRALHQRVTLFCEIQALSEKETPLYVEYRLKVSGLREQLFTAQAMQMIHTFSQGNPRLINILCDRAMRIGQMKKRKKIDADIIIECARDMKLGNRLKVKFFELIGPGLLKLRREHPIRLKNWATAAGPAMRTAQSWLRLQGKAMSPRIRSLGRTLANESLNVSRRFVTEFRSKDHPVVWMAGIGLIAFLLMLTVFNANRGKNSPIETAAKPDAAIQQDTSAGSDDPQWATVENSPGDPTVLASTAPSPARQRDAAPEHRQPENGRQPAPENLHPSHQLDAGELEASPLQTAALALERKDYQKAIEILESRQVSGGGQNPEAGRLFSNALLGRSLQLMAASPSEAETMLLRAVDVSPDHAQAYVTLGKFRTRTKEYDKAIQAYRNAIRLDPELSDALFNLGYIYATTGKFEDAETAFSGAVQLKPPYMGKSLFNLAVVQDKLGKMEQSLANLEKAVALMPKNEKALAYLNRLKQSASAEKGASDR